eukprot:CAMPEP_0204527508 /NCGR_PEP_ID=MMETSP0661-20131031/9022_1 /ASSEMBLY_ACC=CAM_ASM_000606 /TAXON_ID=109239 /ORGANISM="Alexandrium margalefi, Strain AMGDE01CS-322" /LENGTH=108 /DNA_ID=CAMNT_0051533425 /DNA_START=195 /DNA_END=520 /DNA_ORIENTATION=-
MGTSLHVPLQGVWHANWQQRDGIKREAAIADEPPTHAPRPGMCDCLLRRRLTSGAMCAAWPPATSRSLRVPQPNAHCKLAGQFSVAQDSVLAAAPSPSAFTLWMPMAP